jgi:ABC-type phosphate transport system substrate-binding protein
MKKKVLLVWVFLFLATYFVFPEVLVITNQDTQISSLKKKEIKDIFTGKRSRWNGSGKIIIATLQDSKVHQEFLREFVKKTPSQFKNFWRRKVFTGEGKLPKTFDSETKLINFVSRTKGAVGYISTPTKKPVKVISVKDNKEDPADKIQGPLLGFSLQIIKQGKYWRK